MRQSLILNKHRGIASIVINRQESNPHQQFCFAELGNISSFLNPLQGAGFCALLAIEIDVRLRLMDPSLSHSPPEVEEDEWGISQPPATTISHQFRTSYEWKALTKDTDGFVIPSLSIGGDSDLTSIHVRGVTDSRPPESIIKEADKIYLGPHGAPPQAKQQELNAAGRKHRFKEKLREADCRFSGAGRENKVESLQQLLGSKVRRGSMPKSSARDWLDPHCHESQFEKYP